jgi:hypothetical protein
MESNKLKSLIIVAILSCCVGIAKAQFPAKYWVKFTNKNASPYSVSNPSAFLSARSIARRANQSIAVDITDIPVNQTYINQVNGTGAQVFQRSKWMNAAIVIINNATQLSAVNSLTCVLNSAPVGKYLRATDDVVSNNTVFQLAAKTTASYNYGPSLTQNSMIGADCMHSLGFRGENMVIAIIDAGFNQADINPVFDSLRNESRILGTRDFVAGNNSVYEDDSHGAMVLSCISGNSPGNLIGTGPKASMWLLRSEDVSSEKLIEENNWIIAAEFADSVGADIVNTSLGYNTFDNASQNHVYADLTGKVSVASIAATMASRKGMFMVHAAGNEGAGAWQYINVPSDADSICTVGAVNGSGVHASFSSIGPTADGRIKPEVSTMGEGAYVCQPGYNFAAGNGTSFASPIMAGAVACLWQAHPNKTNMQILEAIKETASKHTSPDNQYGWGIPDMCAAHNYLSITTVQEESKAISVKVFPNPAKEQINFSLTENAKSVTLTDLLGQDISFGLSETENHHYILQLNNSMANGIYFLTIKTNQGISKTKFIKE